jgi:glutamyl-tRNA reductase
MNRIGIVGLDWRQGGPDGLARYTVPVDERLERLPRLHAEIGVRELVYVATCNRVEVFFVAANGTPVAAIRPRVFAALRGREPRPREAEAELTAWGGEGAAEHLFMLASGMQSAMLGEREIIGQLREAVELCTRAGTRGPILGWLFDEAFKLSRRIHRLTALGEGKVSIAELALSHVRERLTRHPGTVALVGVSPMIVHCARALAEDARSNLQDDDKAKKILFGQRRRKKA